MPTWTEEQDMMLRGAVATCVDDWVSIASHVPGRTNAQCYQRWTQSLMPGIRKGKWDKDEDDLLFHLATNVYSIPTKECATAKEDRTFVWTELATQISGRTSKQCRVRWFGRLSPAVNHSEFTKEEDQQMVALHKVCGNKWAWIASQLNGRTSDSVKVRVRTLNRKRRCSTEAPNGHQTKRPKLVANESINNKTHAGLGTVAAKNDGDMFLDPILRLLAEVQDCPSPELPDENDEEFEYDLEELDAWLGEALPEAEMSAEGWCTPSMHMAV